MCSRPKKVFNGPSLFYAAVQHGTFGKERCDDVSEVTDDEVLLVVLSFQCLVWERIYPNILRYRTLREKCVRGKERHAAFMAKCLFSFHSNSKVSRDCLISSSRLCQGLSQLWGPSQGQPHQVGAVSIAGKNRQQPQESALGESWDPGEPPRVPSASLAPCV